MSKGRLAAIPVLVCGLFTLSSLAIEPNSAKAPAPDKDDFAALTQARKSGVNRCAPLLGELFRLSVVGKHTSVSTWFKDSPDTRLFSAVTLSAGSPDKPRALLSVVAAAPAPGKGCDGDNVNVEVVTASCDEVAADLVRKKAPEPERLGALRIFAPNQVGQRVALIPDSSKGCVVVSTGVYFGR